MKSKSSDFDTKKQRFQRLFSKWEKQKINSEESLELNKLYVELEQLDDDIEMIKLNIEYKMLSDSRGIKNP